MEEDKIHFQKTSSAIFLGTISVAFVALIPVVFPALLLRMFGGMEDHAGINPFEPGVWAIPFLIVNAMSFAFLFLYLKKRLPKIFSRWPGMISSFDISPQHEVFLLAVLVGAFIAFNAGGVFNDFYDDDFTDHVKSSLEGFSFANFDAIYVQNFLQKLSVIIFGNYKIIPFLSSVALLFVTYLLTKQITKKRFPGLVSVAILLYSGIFLHYDDSAAYPNFWILFYLTSLYVVLRASLLSPAFYVLGVLSKSLVAAFLPMSLYFIFQSAIPKKKKIITGIIYGAIILSAILGLFVFKSSPQEYDITELSMHDFWSGFSSISASLRHDPVLFLFLLPVISGLYVISNKARHADSVMFLIFGIIISAPIMAAVSILINTPYRFVPLVVFFAIGVGLLFSKADK